MSRGHGVTVFSYLGGLLLGGNDQAFILCVDQSLEGGHLGRACTWGGVSLQKRTSLKAVF